MKSWRKKATTVYNGKSGNNISCLDLNKTAGTFRFLVIIFAKFCQPSRKLVQYLT